MSFKYLLIRLYASQYAPESLVAMQKSFAADAERAGINLVSSTKQNDTIANLINGWGI